jgi:hypothetical protein
VQLLLLIIGLVGIIVPEQFSGQDALGWAFIALSVVITLFQVAFYLIAARKIKQTHSDFFDRHPRL